MRLFRMESPLPGQWGLLGRRTLEAGLALATGLLLARFVWLSVEPAILQQQGTRLPVMTSASFQGTTANSSLGRIDPFAESGLSQAQFEDALPTSLNLRLTGLRWAGDQAGSGSAIIVLPDGSQKLVSPGERILDGAILDTIASDRIFLRSNGRLEELRLQARGGSFGAPRAVDAPEVAQAATAATPPARATTPAQLASDVILQPDLRNGAVAGYRLSPRGNGHFEQAGLEPEDLVLRVNGQSVEGMSPEALQTAVTASEAISLDVVRRGAIVRLRISPDSGLAQ